MNVSMSPFELGFLLIWIGIFIIFIGFMMMGRKSHSTKGGGIILIGPFPIIWGSDRGIVKWLILIAVIFIIFYLIIFFPFVYRLSL